MASRMASEDLRWAEKKQKYGVMTTSRGADLKVVTAMELNHDAVHTTSYSQELGHVVCRDKLDMLSTGKSFRVPDAPRNVKGISSHSRWWLVRLRKFRKQGIVDVRV
jgi:hypothetical protein